MQQTAEWFRQVPVTQIVASDLPRTVQSAQLISQTTGAPIRTDPRLRSMDLGTFTTQLITPERKDAFSRAQNVDRDSRLPGSSESYNDFLSRYKSILPELVQAGQKQNVVVVTHHRNLLALPELFYNKRAQTTDDTLPGSVGVLGKKGLQVLFTPPGDPQTEYKELSKS